jgi:hypothetical protein
MPARQKLSTRLSALEQTAEAGVELSDSEKGMLVAILARRDALFWPWRWSLGHQPPVVEIRCRQRDYLNGTQGVAAKADGRSQWKDAHFIRQRLIAAKMVTANYSGGQVTNLLLAPDGELTARSLVGGRLCKLGDPEVKRLYAAILLHKQIHDRPIREHELFQCDCEGDPSQWEHHTERVLPLLTAGIVRAETDTTCRILYVVGDGAEIVEPTAMSLPSDAKWDQVYIRSFNSERTTLGSVEPRDADEIFIPHGACT